MSTIEKYQDLNKKFKIKKEVLVKSKTTELFNAHDFYDNVLVP